MVAVRFHSMPAAATSRRSRIIYTLCARRKVPATYFRLQVSSCVLCVRPSVPGSFGEPYADLEVEAAKARLPALSGPIAPVVKADVVAAAAFDVVHGFVGLADERFAIGAVAGVDAYADA